MKILDRIPRFLTSAVVTAGVLYLTLAPRPFGSVRIPLFEGADKVVHFMMFFAMAFAYHFDFRRGKKPVDEARLMGWIFVSLSAFGGLIGRCGWGAAAIGMTCLPTSLALSMASFWLG